MLEAFEARSALEISETQKLSFLNEEDSLKAFSYSRT